ncbi:hypothetical protein K458DRAFT_415423 [Lentithecium fluviatile CBS 122367]|uniref:Uncharacterized protein n=1 Tax=Lentithecium fluviatile CBS 122367 TaxID=1168545 RepID=A0A6G1JAI8_9PLEO|nr:hypothetical protein K458DRAFT_415423 [Lentithecium fluviatile CBS 122367]
MSGLEVFAAVAAVVSAFHGGADLVANIKKQARRRSSNSENEDEAERKKLQVSLETGESQIGFRYAADMNKFGDIIRVGDAIARDRILHIAVVIQTEIIMSLQLAVKYENAVLDIAVLHEASILNRKDTIDALDELKQRIFLRGAVPRSLTDPSQRLSDDTQSSIDTMSVRSSRSSIPRSPVPDNCFPNAVSLLPEGAAQSEKTALARYFAGQDKDKASPLSATNPSLTSPSESLNFHPALEHLLRGKGPEERAAIMKDIDEIIAAYQGMSVEGDRAEALAMLTGQESSSKRDTLVVLNGGYGYQRDTVALNRDALRLLGELPPASGVSHENSEYPAQVHNIFDWSNEPKARRLSDWSEQPQHPPMSSRWSTTSAGSCSIYSQNTICSDPPSLYRHNSDSSRGSPVSPDAPEFQTPFYSQNYANSVYSTNTTAPFWGMDRLQNPPNMSHSSSRTNTPPARPITPLSEMPRVFTPHRPRTPVKGSQDGLTAGLTHGHLVPQDEYTYKADRSVKIPNPLNLKLSSSNTNLKNPGKNVTKPLPQVPITPTLSNPNPTPAPAVLDKMMDGRPCKDNNYWGFCKGAWATREDMKKGLGLETRPEGMYNTSQIWQCKHCCFEGASFPNPNTAKRNKKDVIVDPNIYNSAVGIRYRWLFLAKSHVKKKTLNSADPVKMATFHKNRAGTGAAIEDGDCSFGCVICSVEGSVTGIYGNVETLMNHILMDHVRSGNMSEQTMARSKCVLGRTAGSEEEWDINVPKDGVLLF